MSRRRSKLRRTAPAASRRPLFSSPAAVDFALPGLFRRLAALLYDALLLAAVLFAATLILLPLHGGEAFRPHDLLFSAYLLGIGFMFFGWFWIHGGQTLGMRAWKIRLQAADGEPISWKQAAIRYAAAAVSLGLFGLGYLWILFDPQRRSWHDLMSGTRVVMVNKA
jgi:uncharacterized RDD family membrane protein YckC